MTVTGNGASPVNVMVNGTGFDSPVSPSSTEEPVIDNVGRETTGVPH